MEEALRSRAPSRLLAEIRLRLLPHAIVIAVLWPIASIAFAGLMLREHPVTSGVPTRMLFAGAAAGALEMLPELGVGAAILLGTSVLLFASIAVMSRRARAPGGNLRRRVLTAEPFLLFLAAILGAAAEYPAILRHPALLLRPFPVAVAVGLLGGATAVFAVALGRARGGKRGIALGLLGAAIVAVVTRTAARPLGRTTAPSSGTHGQVLLGIDSILQTDDVAALRNDVKRLGGNWYERPVPPGLLTNSVWPAILMGRPPRETGVFLVFQKTDWSRYPDNVVRRARRNGCATFAYLETGFTAYVGREAGFDVDRSGPRGWLQPATAAVKNASILLPLVLARLPPIPGAVTPPNQTGTFNYDLRREIREVLTRRSDRACTFVAAHFDYLHQTAFPAMSEMTREERHAVRSARAGELLDPSLAWQLPVLVVDPLRLYAWKIARLQRVIGEEVRATHFLDPRKQNRLITFFRSRKPPRTHGGQFRPPALPSRPACDLRGAGARPVCPDFPSRHPGV